MTSRDVKRRMKEMLLFVPNMVRLCGRLMLDARVPKTEKALVAAAIVYAISPLDFIPDFVPFVGQVDDAYLIVLTLLRLFNNTDARVLQEHWRGGGNIVQIAQTIAGLAPRFLPQRTARVLSAKVELKGQRLNIEG